MNIPTITELLEQALALAKAQPQLPPIPEGFEEAIPPLNTLLDPDEWLWLSLNDLKRHGDNYTPCDCSFGAFELEKYKFAKRIPQPARWTLPEGYRPLLRGESEQIGDEYITNSGWEKTRDVYVEEAGKFNAHFRTTRPLPAPKVELKTLAELVLELTGLIEDGTAQVVPCPCFRSLQDKLRLETLLRDMEQQAKRDMAFAQACHVTDRSPVDPYQV